MNQVTELLSGTLIVEALGKLWGFEQMHAPATRVVRIHATPDILGELPKSIEAVPSFYSLPVQVLNGERRIELEYADGSRIAHTL